MSIDKALKELYAERARLTAEQERLKDAIEALEALDGSSRATARPPKKMDGRSAPKPPITCPFCGTTSKGMAGVAAHVRSGHPEKYPAAYEAWKATR